MTDSDELSAAEIVDLAIGPARNPLPQDDSPESIAARALGKAADTPPDFYRRRFLNVAR